MQYTHTRHLRQKMKNEKHHLGISVSSLLSCFTAPLFSATRHFFIVWHEDQPYIYSTINRIVHSFCNQSYRRNILFCLQQSCFCCIEHTHCTDDDWSNSIACFCKWPCDHSHTCVSSRQYHYRWYMRVQFWGWVGLNCT